MAPVASINSTLRFLLERLNWPVRMTRAVAAREYAKLLSSSAFKKKAAAAFLHWLSTRALESQVATGLAVLLCTDDEALPPLPEVREAIHHPSIITDLLLQHIYGFGKIKGGWRSMHSGLVPDSFVPEKYFEDHKTAHVPLHFSGQIERLERRYWFPFARQWAFEWRTLMDREDASYSDFPHHFVGNLTRSGIIGQFEVAQSDVMRSAYLRMLACAVSEDAMTAQQAGVYAMDCLPVNRGLFRIKPIVRPTWLSNIPEQCCAEGASLEAGARQLIAKNINSPGMRPVKLVTPISADLFEFADLTISAVMVTSDFVPPEMEEPYFAPGALWSLPDAISFEGLLGEQDMTRVTVEGKAGRCTPVCNDIFPLPFGYWLSDYIVVGYALPAPYLFLEPPSVRCDERGIEVRSHNATVGRLFIWLDRWTPLYAKGGGNTRCGILTEIGEADLDRALQRQGLRLGWAVQLRIWSRKTDYGEYELSTRREFFFD